MRKHEMGKNGKKWKIYSFPEKNCLWVWKSLSGDSVDRWILKFFVPFCTWWWWVEIWRDWLTWWYEIWMSSYSLTATTDYMEMNENVITWRLKVRKTFVTSQSWFRIQEICKLGIFLCKRCRDSHTATTHFHLNCRKEHFDLLWSSE